MRTTKRFEQATEKLYTAFNNGTLNAFNCTACAVGNMLGTNEHWQLHAISVNNELISLPIFDRTYPFHKDYNNTEIEEVETRFLTAWAEENKLDDRFAHDKEIQFNGLMNVINYLAELDNIETIENQYNKFNEVLKRETA